jgi:hypothetical protein
MEVITAVKITDMQLDLSIAKRIAPAFRGAILFFYLKSRGTLLAVPLAIAA